jgi:hypothetical protein
MTDLTMNDDARFRHDVPVKVDGREYTVTVNVIAYAHMRASKGNSEVPFTSASVRLDPALIQATGETVFRMDLTDVEKTIRELAAGGAFDGD